MQCNWDRAWAGRCLKEAAENGFCPEHQDKCCVCHEKATRDCDYALSLICGVPLCDECQHKHGSSDY